MASDQTHQLVEAIDEKYFKQLESVSPKSSARSLRTKWRFIRSGIDFSLIQIKANEAISQLLEDWTEIAESAFGFSSIDGKRADTPSQPLLFGF